MEGKSPNLAKKETDGTLDSKDQIIKNLIDKNNNLLSEYLFLKKEKKDRGVIYKNYEEEEKAIINMMAFNSDNPEFFTEVNNFSDVQNNIALKMLELQEEERQEMNSLSALRGMLRSAQRQGRDDLISKVKEVIKRKNEKCRSKFKIYENMSDREKYNLLQNLRKEKEYAQEEFVRLEYYKSLEKITDSLNSSLSESEENGFIETLKDRLLEFLEASTKENLTLREVFGGVMDRISLRLVELSSSPDHLYSGELEDAKKIALDDEIYEIMPKINDYIEKKQQGLSRDPSSY